MKADRIAAFAMASGWRMLVCCLCWSFGPGEACAQGRIQLLHERLPAAGQPAGTDRALATTGRDRLRSPSSQVGGTGRPADRPPPPQYGLQAFAESRLDRVVADRRTGAAKTLHYGVVFNPTVAPYKRDVVFDQISSQGVAQRSNTGRRMLHTEGMGLRPGHELFWGHISLRLKAGQPAPIPSIAPTSSLLQWQSTPARRLRFFRDRAGNLSVVSDRAGDVVLRFLVDAPDGYFASPLGDGRALRDPWRPRLAPPLKRRLKRLWSLLRVDPKRLSRRENLRRLSAYFRSFVAGSAPPPGGHALTDLIVSQRGICRHRSLAFMAVAHSLSIPAMVVTNDAHAFVEVWVVRNDGSEGWLRIDLGGGAESMQLHGGQDKNRHQPLFRDPMPRPQAFVETSTRVLPSAGSGADQGTEAPPVPATVKKARARSARLAVTGDKTASSAAPAVSVSRTSLSSSERAWLDARRKRLDRRTGGVSNASGSTGPSVNTESRRWRSRVVLRSPVGVGYVGEKLQIRGTLAVDDGGAKAKRRLEIWLIESRRPWLGNKLGTVMSDPNGAFTTQVHIPLDSELATYELVARFAGDRLVAPSDSSARAAQTNARRSPR